VREVKKKVLVVAVALMAVAMLATPLVGTVMAGKGQEKLSFRLVMIGHYTPPAKVIETENTIHYFDLGFMFHNPLNSDPALVVEIDGEELPASRLGGGSGLIHLNANKEGYTIQVTDIITIKAADGHVMGDIVNLAIGNLNKGNGVGGGMNFQGHGTDELEGVKVNGVTTSVEVIGEWTNPMGVVLNITRVERVGTIMGWST
jgi:hypothetical protein